MEKEIEQVKKRIWAYGFSCKGAVAGPESNYDLIVEYEFPVKVVTAGADLESIPKRIIVAVVDGANVDYRVCKRGVCSMESSPLSVFPRKDIINQPTK